MAPSQIAFGYGGITASTKFREYQKDRTPGYSHQGLSDSQAVVFGGFVFFNCNNLVVVILDSLQELLLPD